MYKIPQALTKENKIMNNKAKRPLLSACEQHQHGHHAGARISLRPVRRR